jgi:hypothetical protein
VRCCRRSRQRQAADAQAGVVLQCVRIEHPQPDGSSGCSKLLSRQAALEIEMRTLHFGGAVTYTLLAAALALAAAASPAGAQSEAALRDGPVVSPTWFRIQVADGLRTAPVGSAASFVVQAEPLPRLVVGGLAGGAAGALAGGLITGGLRALGPCDDQDGCLDVYADWAVSGAFAGGSLLLPVGVHIANGRRGSLAPAMAASAAIGAGGLAAWWAIQNNLTDEWGNDLRAADALTALTVIATPALQLASSVLIERATSRRRAGR